MTGSSTLRSSILKLFSEVIRSSSSAVAVEALVESGTIVVCDTACLRIKMTMITLLVKERQKNNNNKNGKKEVILVKHDGGGMLTIDLLH